MTVPWFALALGGLSLLPQLGNGERMRILRDIKSCRAQDEVGTGYSWVRGSLTAVKPIEICVDQGGMTFTHRFAKYRYESYKVSRVLQVSEVAPASKAKSEAAPLSSSAQKEAVKPQRVQKWKTTQTLMQHSPVVYGTGLLVDGRFTVDAMRDKIALKRVQSIFTGLF